MKEESVIDTLYKMMSLKQQKQVRDYMRDIIHDDLMSHDLKNAHINAPEINGGLNYVI